MEYFGIVFIHFTFFVFKNEKNQRFGGCNLMYVLYCNVSGEIQYRNYRKVSIIDVPMLGSRKVNHNL